MRRPRITVVGIGDDGPAGLGDHARDAIASAEVLCGGTRHLAMFPDHPARKVDLSTDFAGALRLLEAESSGRQVVLASGDPMLFGIGATLVARLGAGRVEILPHVSSVQVAFARLCEPMRDVVTLSAHGRELRPVLARAMGCARAAILLDDHNDACTVAGALLDAGMEDAEAAVCSHLDGERERIVRGRLSQIVAGGPHPALSLLVVLRDPVEVAPYRRSAIPDEEFAHRNGMITKAEVRALSVAALRLRPSDVLWDVGAGSGAVGIEAALQLPDGSVYAVERDPAQVAFIRENRVRFRTPQVEAIEADIKEALATLPDPDAVFVGGGGTALPAIIDACAERLRPGGRLVLNLVAVERIAEVIGQLRRWTPEVTQVSIARGVAIASATRLEALNPVSIVAATKPGDRT
ncbi:MAG: precorrin-6y C5,15-methyltransferase (decarboxylating) subunit CbiE [Dehalococcoidia bacterium]|nr:MAG: precorrin-6y C5,15-methyltransferase (decarboxylating) subunit CbiE [Dehalococcoidia bacterium]